VPPVKPGAVNVTVTEVGEAIVAVPITGAPGATALTANVWLTCAAGRWLASPAWSAVIVQVPAVRKANAPVGVTVHTDGVAEAKLTGSPESAVADSVGVVPKSCAPGLANVMTCVAAVTTALDAAEAEPVPALLVAVTMNV